MLNFRTLTRRWLPPSLKRFRPKVIFVEDEQLDPRESQIVRTMNRDGYELCAQNVIILDKINEYFLIDRTTS